MKNEQLTQLIKALKVQAIQKKAAFWKRIASELEKSSRNRREVNLYKLEQFAKEGEIVVVPGKVLGAGILSKKLTVAALSFSQSAKEKIQSNKGEILTITELIKKEPNVQTLRIMG